MPNAIAMLITMETNSKVIRDAKVLGLNIIDLNGEQNLFFDNNVDSNLSANKKRNRKSNTN